MVINSEFHSVLRMCKLMVWLCDLWITVYVKKTPRYPSTVQKGEPNEFVQSISFNTGFLSSRGSFRAFMSRSFCIVSGRLNNYSRKLHVKQGDLTICMFKNSESKPRQEGSSLSLERDFFTRTPSSFPP